MKTATNICSATAEDLTKLPADTVLISISNEYEADWNLQVSGPNVLKLKFADIRHTFTHTNGKTYHPMTVDDAHEIIQFIELHQDKNIIINCAAGISRSGALALYINMIYGHQLKTNFWKLSEPNPFCLGTLISEFYKLKDSKII